jgi:ribonucleoside-diphosphate reductase beta chain
MAKLKDLVMDEGVDPQILDDIVTELMPFVNGIAADPDEIYVDRGIGPDELREFATSKHVDRMKQIRDADEEIPDVETLTKLDA